MLLHRYFGSYALETLKNAELWASRISAFNDPFEFMYVNTGKITPAQAEQFCLGLLNTPSKFLEVKALHPNLTDEAIRQLIQQQLPSMIQKIVENFKTISELPLKRRQQIIDEELRAICFSDPSRIKPLDEILLWSHYANKHEGVRIGFEFPDGIKEPFEITPITYQQNRVEVDLSFGVEYEQTHAALEKSATVKSLSWEYEREYRLFVKVGRCEDRRTPGSAVEQLFLGFKREWVKSVDFGVSCSGATIRPIVDVLKSDYPGIIPKKAMFHETDYALTYKEF
jgi:hypothetical protein